MNTSDNIEKGLTTQFKEFCTSLKSRPLSSTQVDNIKRIMKGLEKKEEWAMQRAQEILEAAEIYNQKKNAQDEAEKRVDPSTIAWHNAKFKIILNP